MSINVSRMIGLGDDVLSFIVAGIVGSGYHRISSAIYLDNVPRSSVKELQASFLHLPDEKDVGGRLHSYGRLTVKGSEIFKTDIQEYSQSKEYNSTDGGRVRKLSPLQESVTKSALLHRVIEVDVEIARKTGIVSFDRSVRVGIHQIRYEPEKDKYKVSYSSPPGPHKDDEPIVFIHHFDESKNVIGGDNTIGKSEDDYTDLIKLKHVLDTLCVTQECYHSVTPIGLDSGDVGHRHVVLVTVQVETDESLSLSPDKLLFTMSR